MINDWCECFNAYVKVLVNKLVILDMENNKKVPTVAEFIDKNEKYASDLDHALAVAGK